MTEIVLCVGGSRDYNNRDFIYKKLDYLLQSRSKEEVKIISGAGGFVDKTAIEYAKDRGYDYEEFPAEWENFNDPCLVKVNKYGKKYNALAGFRRNEVMASKATHYVGFRKDNSPGTSDMYERALDWKLKVRLYEVC